MDNQKYRRISIYRDDSTTPVVYKPVKHFWWTAGNSILTISYITDLETGAHNYVHWPRESFTWFRDEKLEVE